MAYNRFIGYDLIRAEDPNSCNMFKTQGGILNTKMDKSLVKQWKHTILLTAMAATWSWSSLTIIMKNGQGQPIPGVSCSQYGGTPAITDVSGTLTLAPSSIFNSHKNTYSNYSLSQIPLASGETANFKIMDIKGKVLVQRQVSLGQRIEFAYKNSGIYFVNISSRNYSAQGRIVYTGNGLVFETVPVNNLAGVTLAKTSGANSASIICSKTGYTTQGYQLLDGSTNTIDFTKLTIVPLYDAATQLEPALIEETDSATITHWVDRARDRHGREAKFHAYDHYLPHYWEHRTARINIIDFTTKGKSKIFIDVRTEWPLQKGAEEFRAFYLGINTPAEYLENTHMTPDPNDPLHYTQVFTQHVSVDRVTKKYTFRDLKPGDKMEIEVSQFLEPKPANHDTLVGRPRYYGTIMLYNIGPGGFSPWEEHGVYIEPADMATASPADIASERGDSYPIPKAGWSGGTMTLPYQYSNEPQGVFIEMAPNMASKNGQVFVKGRRVHHSSFIDGTHDESSDNPVFKDFVGKSGVNYINQRCTGCHNLNGRALPPGLDSVLTRYVVKVGDGNGNPHPLLGGSLQPQRIGGNPEGSVVIHSWTETNGLRKPNFVFSGSAIPTQYSARISPQLVGLGLLDAIPESAIQALADSADVNSDGISGRMQLSPDYYTGAMHLGRFGWKAGKPSVKQQVAGALNSDMGVMTSVYPNPDCGSAQTNCGTSGSEVADSNFQNLVDYISLLGVPARRDLSDPVALQGENLFTSAGCVACHTTTFTTTAYHPKQELRNQVIHPYTDLLLHDMGPGLADNLPELGASGAEWRTSPLWGIGLTAGVSGGEAYLHDGRARTLTEAILWHGGEADASTNKFKAMSSGEQAAIIKFLKSL